MGRILTSLIIWLAAGHAVAEEYPAVLDWTQRVVLGTAVSGAVVATPVAAGERVNEGQVRVQLDPRPFDSAVKDAEAQVRKHELNRDEAKRELQRTRELFSRTVISVHDLQLKEIAFVSAEADYASARARLEEARLHREYATVRAPYAGMVVDVRVAAGEAVVNTQQATPLVVLVRDRPMGARARVPADAVGELVPGQTARVQVNGRTYPGAVEQVGMEPDAEGRYVLAVSFDPGASVLRAGLPAQVITGR